MCFALTSQPLCVVSREDYASTRRMTYVALHNLGSLEAIGRWNAFQENMTIAFKAWCALIATVGRYVKSLFQHFCAFNVISKSAAKLQRIFWIAKSLAWYFSAAISLYTLCIKKFVTANRRQSYNPWPQPFCVARKNSRDVYKFCSIFDSSTSWLFRLPQKPQVRQRHEEQLQTLWLCAIENVPLATSTSAMQPPPIKEKELLSRRAGWAAN